MNRRKWREPYAHAVLNDRSTAATQVHEAVLALVHSQLTAPDDERAVADACDVRGAAGSAAEEEAFRCGVDG